MKTTNKNIMEKKKKQPKFLTEAHRKNYEKGMEQIKKWSNSSATLEEIMQRQKEREK